MIVGRNESPQILPRSHIEFTFHFTVFLKIWGCHQKESHKFYLMFYLCKCNLILPPSANFPPVECCPVQWHRSQVISFHFQRVSIVPITVFLELKNQGTFTSNTDKYWSLLTPEDSRSCLFAIQITAHKRHEPQVYSSPTGEKIFKN